MAEYASLVHKHSRLRVMDVDLESLKGHWSSTWYLEEGFSIAGVIVLEVGPRSKTARENCYRYLVEDEINSGDVIWKQV